jgi:lysophospholipase L1-like esterase
MAPSNNEQTLNSNKMNQHDNGRRNFIKTTAAGSVMALGLSQIVSSAYGSAKAPKISLKKDDVILFQGDSITDAGRNREELSFNRGLGNGYAMLATSKLLHDQPSKTLHIYNRGISGNKVYQLAERWDADCLALKPTVLSVLIGVNDFWHLLTGRYDGTIEKYRDDYKALLQRTKENLPGIKFIVGEPFAVNGVKAVDDQWFPRFNEYQKAAREIAEEFGAVLIPYQSIFDKASKVAPASYWTGDGVHTTLAGSQLMAEAWLRTVGN